MIQLTRINHASLVLNSDLIEHIEVTPDTVISMTTGQKFMVRETADEVIQRVIAFRQAICEALALPAGVHPGVTSASRRPSRREEEEEEDAVETDRGTARNGETH